MSSGRETKSGSVKIPTLSPFDLQHQQSDVASKIVVGLERVAEIFRVLLWNYAKDLNLSPIQIQILIFLKYHEEDRSTVSYLAQEFNLARPTISDAVAALQTKGLVDKIRSVKDSRSSSVRLTKEGEQSVRATECFANPFTQIVADLSETEKVAFWSVLSRIIYKANQEGLISVQRMCFNCKFYEPRKEKSYCHLLAKELRSQDIRIDCPEFIVGV